jgi:hypothetical protein
LDVDAEGDLFFDLFFEALGFFDDLFVALGFFDDLRRFPPVAPPITDIMYYILYIIRSIFYLILINN